MGALRIVGNGADLRNKKAIPPNPELAMLSVSCSRNLVLFSVFTAALGVSGPARADYIYGRLVPGAGIQPNGESTSVDVSADGRTVVFSSDANNWVGDSYNGTRAVAVDLDTGVVEAVSRQGTTVIRGESPVVSGDGRYVAFLTLNSSFGQGWQVLRKDRDTGVLVLASANSAGQPPANGTNDNTVSISADGRYVAFQTDANLTQIETMQEAGAAPEGSSGEIYVKDMQTGSVEMASLTSGGIPSGGDCSLQNHALSASGRYLAMRCSDAMVGGATAGQIYVRDLQANTTELASRSASAPNGPSAFSDRPAISPDGRFVSFESRGYGGLGYANGSNIEGNSGVYLRDRQTGTTISIPRPTVIPTANYDSCNVSSVSDIGSVLLSCNYSWFGSGSFPQVFLYVPGAGAPGMISVTGSSQPGNNASGYTTAVNASGLSMAWESIASNIDPGDTNGVSDIIVLVEESLLSDVIFADGFEP